MKVQDIMTSPVISVGPDATFGEIVELLLVNDISGLPVIDDDGELVGIVTEADLVTKEAYGHQRRRTLGLLADYLRGHDPQWVRKAGGRTAREVMTTGPAVASPADDLAAAARRMLEDHHKRLPVVEDGRVVGIVSRSDLLQPFHRSDSDIALDVERLLRDPLRVPERLEVETEVVDGVVTLRGVTQWPSDIGVLAMVIDAIPGVIGVENLLEARLSEPRV